MHSIGVHFPPTIFVCFSLTVLLFSVAALQCNRRRRRSPPPHPNRVARLLPAPGETPVYSGPTGTAPEPSGPLAATSPAPTKWLSTRRAACFMPVTAAALLRAVCPALPVVLPAVARRAIAGVVAAGGVISASPVVQVFE